MNFLGAKNGASRADKATITTLTVKVASDSTATTTDLGTDFVDDVTDMAEVPYHEEVRRPSLFSLDESTLGALWNKVKKEVKLQESHLSETAPQRASSEPSTAQMKDKLPASALPETTETTTSSEPLVTQEKETLPGAHSKSATQRIFTVLSEDRPFGEILESLIADGSSRLGVLRNQVKEEEKRQPSPLSETVIPTKSLRSSKPLLDEIKEELADPHSTFESLWDDGKQEGEIPKPHLQESLAQPDSPEGLLNQFKDTLTQKAGNPTWRTQHWSSDLRVRLNGHQHTLSLLQGVIFLGLILHLLSIFFPPGRRRLSINRKRTCKSLYQTSSWPGFWALTKKYTLGGSVRWGPWDTTSISNHCQNKQVLRDLVRWGIIPLAIRPGGTIAYKAREPSFKGGRYRGPEYVRSHGRAYFQFVVPFPDGYVRDNIKDRENRFSRTFMKSLERMAPEFPGIVHISKYNCSKTGKRYISYNVQGYSNVGHFTSNRGPPSSNVPLERGTRSFHPWLHLFQGVYNLVPGIGGLIGLDHFMEDPMLAAPLLYFNPHAIVHIEGWNALDHRLDQMVHALASAAGAQELYDDDFLQTSFRNLVGDDADASSSSDPPQ